MNPRTRLIIIGIVILAVAGIGGWLASRYFFSGKDEKPLVEHSGPLKPSEIPVALETRVPVIFYYYSESGLGREERTIAGNALPVKMAETLLQEYVKGLPKELREVTVRGVYRDAARVLYVDLSDDLRRNFAGDARSEYYFLKALYQTIVTNVTDIKDVKLLVEGREIETIGGHISILTPLRDTVGL